MLFCLIQRSAITAFLACGLYCVAQLAPDPLAWDSLSKQQTLAPGETAAHFTFSVTNISAAEVVIQSVAPSCGCTVAQLPAQPWRLAPGAHGKLKFTMDLRGKWGTLVKSATVHTSTGPKVLTMSAIMPAVAADVSPLTPASARADLHRLLQVQAGRDVLPRVLTPSSIGQDGRPAGHPYLDEATPSPFVGRGERDGVRGARSDHIAGAGSDNGTRTSRPSEMQGMNRSQNQALALADHQAVFRGDCARCHSEPAKGKLGMELYVSVCGICHDAEHRADMVPLLGKSDQATNPAYWRTWITFGKPGSLMPAFSKPLGGPLDREQIESLADYLAGKNQAPR